MAEGVTPTSVAHGYASIDPPVARRAQSVAVIDYQTAATRRDETSSALRRGIIGLLRVALTLAIGMTFVVGVVSTIAPFVVWLVYGEPFHLDVFCSGLGILTGAAIGFVIGDRFLRWLSAP